MKNSFVSAGCGLVAAVAMTYASEASAANVTGKISTIEFDGNNQISFALAGSPTLCSNGNTTNNRGAVVVGVGGVTVDGMKMLYSTLMSAFLAGKSVTVHTNDSVATTGWGCTVWALTLDAS